MAVLQPQWETQTRISPESNKSTGPVTAGDTAGEAPAADEPTAAAEPQAADRPILVYVVTTDAVEAFDKIEKVVLADDKVAIGSNFFRRVKMSPDDVEKDPALAGKGKEVPRFLVVSPDWKNVEVVEGTKLTVGGLYKAMETTAKKSLAGDFDKNVKEVRALMNEWDKISKQRTVLDEKKAREGDKASPADVKKMDAEYADLDARQKKADERKAELMTVKLKAHAA